MLSIVIPAWNAAAHIPRTLAALADSGIGGEIVVADANSSDGTAAEAARLGARVVASARGRGNQLRAGAGMARGDWLLFLHADSVPGAGFAEAVTRFIAEPRNRAGAGESSCECTPIGVTRALNDAPLSGRAGYFRLRLDDPARAARMIEWLANWRANALALPYGDQGLLLSRALYDSVGGIPPLPIMEDVALVRRIGRRRLVQLDAELVTSAERYRRDGYLLRPLRNLVCLALYFLGVAPERITKFYD